MNLVRHWERKAPTLILGTTVALVMTCSPAFADLSKSGTAGCNQNQGAQVHSYSNGQTEVTVQGFFNVYYLGSTITHKTTGAGHSGVASWKVSTNNTLSDPGTYANCITTGPY